MFLNFIKSNGISQNILDIFSRGKVYRNDFFEEIRRINYNRVKNISVVILLLAVYTLIIDFLFSEGWQDRQVQQLIRLDIALAFVAIYYVLSTRIFRVNQDTKLTLLHNINSGIFIAFMICWVATISGIEAENVNGVPTFLIGVFGIVVLFYLRLVFAALYLLVGTSILFLFLYFSEPDFNTLLTTNYSSVAALILIAFALSRILFIAKYRSYIATRALEESKRTLDQKVKERTLELTYSNKQLTAEITERKKYEKELTVALQQAEEADRLKSVFLANMSHEIRTPLNGILGFSDLLFNPNLTEQKRERYLEVIKNNGQQLLKIIDDILDISMIESDQIRINEIEFELNKVLDELVIVYNAHSKNSKEKKIKLSLEKYFDDGYDKIISDPTRLQQVLNNLLDNAFKFSEKGEVRFGYEIESGDLRFFVEDTGIGIPYDKQKLIFERFRQNEENLCRSYGGQGLGLSISKGLVELLGGNIWMDIKYTDGARFYFTIPHKYHHVEYSDNMETKDGIAHIDADLSDITILIVEDDITSFTYLAELLEPYNPFVLRATDGQKAINIVKTDEKIDLILMDIHLPIVDGYEATREIKKINPRIPIIAQTANAMDSDRVKSIQAGCDDYVSKPINPELLIKKMVDFIFKGVNYKG